MTCLRRAWNAIDLSPTRRLILHAAESPETAKAPLSVGRGCLRQSKSKADSRDSHIIDYYLHIFNTCMERYTL